MARSASSAKKIQSVPVVETAVVKGRKSSRYMQRYTQANSATFPKLKGRKNMFCGQTRTHRVIREINARLNEPEGELAVLYPKNTPAHLKLPLEDCRGAQKISRGATVAFARALTAKGQDIVRRAVFITSWIKQNRTTDAGDIRAGLLLANLK